MSILDKMTVFFVVVALCQVINTAINLYVVIKGDTW